MNPRLQKLFSAIESQREILLLPLHHLSGEALNHRPQGKWSITQIIAHLITAEKLSVNYLNKKLQGVNEAKDSGPVEELKMILLIVSQRLPLKFKAPKVVVDQTAKETDIHKLVDEWDKTRAALKNILEGIEDQHLKRKIYRHVVAGMLNIQHALKFLYEHVRHHTPQVKYLLKQK